MSATPREKLYSPTLLGLATQLAKYPLHDDLSQVGEAHSRTCGSSVVCGLKSDANGRLSELGLRTSACAVGQAAAAIFAQNAEGHDQAALDEYILAIEDWLGGKGHQPDWPGIDALQPAIAFPARHAAILLAWKAASEALSKARVAS
ncbi:iron-sulfur cluster assembly scaffold protein [Altererythrobacter sp. MF3-039]|uniref:iron-sulfur cluster assembly scaffold protein n=1 Tax=Altererythrobacter sp. MF3-039 TaxID=3252901 RepID=UPI00390CA44F